MDNADALRDGQGWNSDAPAAFHVCTLHSASLGVLNAFWRLCYCIHRSTSIIVDHIQCMEWALLFSRRYVRRHRKKITNVTLPPKMEKSSVLYNYPSIFQQYTTLQWVSVQSETLSNSQTWTHTHKPPKWLRSRILPHTVIWSSRVDQ